VGRSEGVIGCQEKKLSLSGNKEGITSGGGFKGANLRRKFQDQVGGQGGRREISLSAGWGGRSWRICRGQSSELTGVPRSVPSSLGAKTIGAYETCCGRPRLLIKKR